VRGAQRQECCNNQTVTLELRCRCDCRSPEHLKIAHSMLVLRPWTTWTPLVLVLGVSMIKEAREDYKRHQADVEINNRPVEVLDASTRAFVTKSWKDVVVGDIVIVKKDEALPADVLFLSAENDEGTCYVETMNLDGETNLKIKKTLDATKDLRYETIPSFMGAVECEGPNSRLYTFTGNLLLEPPHSPGPDAAKLPISPAAVLLRGCTLRNTERIFGAVIYAGEELLVLERGAMGSSCSQLVS
jgi:phospholipid-transporting ATPase